MKYTLGNGKVSITKWNLNELDIPFIRFAKLEKQHTISSDLLDKNEPEYSETMIFVKNLEGLAVLEYMIKAVKKQLKEQNKLKWKIQMK